MNGDGDIYNDNMGDEEINIEADDDETFIVPPPAPARGRPSNAAKQARAAAAAAAAAAAPKPRGKPGRKPGKQSREKHRMPQPPRGRDSQTSDLQTSEAAYSSVP